MAPKLPDGDALRRASPAALYVYAPSYFYDGTHVINNQSNWHVFEGIDPFTFEVFAKPKGSGMDRYARDRSHVYYYKERVADADAPSFEIVGRHGHARDRRRWYFLGREVTRRGAGERAMGLVLVVDDAAFLSGKPCSVDDPASLIEVDPRIGLLRDRGCVYVVFDPSCYASYSRARLVRCAADPASVTKLGGALFADARNVYSTHALYRSNGELPIHPLADLEPATTRVEGDYAIGRVVYYQDALIVGAAPASFEVLGNARARDATREYICGHAK